mmetsp:Transcript_16973/g.48234  ORF Transcript_16973/g.48234 Transcript_16973/m.48234 type:complete len:208 (+) Transcript_16973:996-1619(+)
MPMHGWIVGRRPTARARRLRSGGASAVGHRQAWRPRRPLRRRRRTGTQAGSPTPPNGCRKSTCRSSTRSGAASAMCPAEARPQLIDCRVRGTSVCRRALIRQQRRHDTHRLRACVCVCRCLCRLLLAPPAPKAPARACSSSGALGEAVTGTPQNTCPGANKSEAHGSRRRGPQCPPPSIAPPSCRVPTTEALGRTTSPDKVPIPGLV